MQSPKNYDHLYKSQTVLSEPLLKAHFALYAGYVKKLGEIQLRLAEADRSKANYTYSEFSELQRRRAVAFNGARLHELYFENLSGTSTAPQGELLQAINTHFGSLDRWLEEAQAGLKTVNGWTLLTFSHLDGSLQNCVLEEHHSGLFVEQSILLAVDGWEHAFMIDYGVDEGAYFKAITPLLDWNVATARFERARGRISMAA